MPRSIRLEYPGAYYQVMARGNRREDIYGDDDDRRFFLKTLGEACGMTGWRVHADVLMSNHSHVLLETPEANLVAWMRWFQATWTIEKWGRPEGAIAALIRKQTTVPTAWIARELALGLASRVSHCVKNASGELLRKLENCW